MATTQPSTYSPCRWETALRAAAMRWPCAMSVAGHEQDGEQDAENSRTAKPCCRSRAWRPRCCRVAVVPAGTARGDQGKPGEHWQQQATPPFGYPGHIVTSENMWVITPPCRCSQARSARPQAAINAVMPNRIRIRCSHTSSHSIHAVEAKVASSAHVVRRAASHMESAVGHQADMRSPSSAFDGRYRRRGTL